MTPLAEDAVIGAVIFLVLRVAVLVAIIWVGVNEFRRWRKGNRE